MSRERGTYAEINGGKQEEIVKALILTAAHDGQVLFYLAAKEPPFVGQITPEAIEDGLFEAAASKSQTAFDVFELLYQDAQLDCYRITRNDQQEVILTKAIVQELFATSIKSPPSNVASLLYEKYKGLLSSPHEREAQPTQEEYIAAAFSTGDKDLESHLLARTVYVASQGAQAQFSLGDLQAKLFADHDKVNQIEQGEMEGFVNSLGALLDKAATIKTSHNKKGDKQRNTTDLTTFFENWFEGKKVMKKHFAERIHDMVVDNKSLNDLIGVCINATLCKLGKSPGHAEEALIQRSTGADEIAQGAKRLKDGFGDALGGAAEKFKSGFGGFFNR